MIIYIILRTLVLTLIIRGIASLFDKPIPAHQKILRDIIATSIILILIAILLEPF